MKELHVRGGFPAGAKITAVYVDGQRFVPEPERLTVWIRQGPNPDERLITSEQIAALQAAFNRGCANIGTPLPAPRVTEPDLRGKGVMTPEQLVREHLAYAQSRFRRVSDLPRQVHHAAQIERVLREAEPDVLERLMAGVRKRLQGARKRTKFKTFSSGMAMAAAAALKKAKTPKRSARRAK